MKKIFTLLLLIFLCSTVSSYAQVTIARWNFEAVTTTNTGNSPVFSAGTATADSGVLTTGSVCSAFHASATSVWSNPSGNGSSKSISSNGWASGDYYQLQFSTTGYNSINISWDQISSNTGPKSFKLQYSTDGTNFTDVPGTITNSTYDVTNDTWSSTAAQNTASIRTANLSTISVLNNASNVYIRLVVAAGSLAVNGSAIASTGTGRIDNFIVTGTSTTPLKLISFNGVAENNRVILNWSTVSEIDVLGFSIERSSDAKNFEAIGFVSAKNNTSNSYAYLDNLVSGLKYYRLKMMDKDGSYQYSNIAAIKTGVTLKLEIYPNPVEEVAVISFPKTNSVSSLRVTSTEGKVLINQMIAVGASQANLNLSNLKSGNYFVVFTDVEGNNSTKTIIKK